MNSRKHYHIFSPSAISHLKLKNRLIRSATAEGGATSKGCLSGEMLNIYQDLANGGVAMIITGHMAVMPEGRTDKTQTAVWDDLHIPEIRQIASRVHYTDPDCAVIAQISHSGRQVLFANNAAACVGPSSIPSPLLEKGARTLSPSEIRVIINHFSKAIIRIKEAGFDGVQLHAGHGWLLSSFLSPATNQRDDIYGGTLENRCRIIREIVACARMEVGRFPILIKLNCDDFMADGIDKECFPMLAKEIEKSGVDAIEISGGMWDCLTRSKTDLEFSPLPLPESRTCIDTPEQQSYFAGYTESLELDIPVILAGGNRNIDLLENMAKQGHIDFFSLCRPLICEPDLPHRWIDGRGSESADCLSCNTCVTTIRNGTTCLMKTSPAVFQDTRRFWDENWREYMR